MWNPRYFIAHLFTEGHVVKVNRSCCANAFNCYLLNNIIQHACEYSHLLYLPPLETLKRKTLLSCEKSLEKTFLSSLVYATSSLKKSTCGQVYFPSGEKDTRRQYSKSSCFKRPTNKKHENTWRKKSLFDEQNLRLYSINSRVRYLWIKRLLALDHARNKKWT